MNAKGLNSNQIKLIAIVAMTVDHLTWTIFPGFQTAWYVIALHIVGRITAPIMWFFIAEGCHYTRNIQKYASRLFLLAVISHFAYTFAFGIPMIPLQTGFFNQTSVIWSLVLSVFLIAIWRTESIPNWEKYAIMALVCVISFPSDWSTIAAMCPFFLYAHRGNFKRQALDIMLWSAVYALVYFLFLDKVYGVLQLFTCLSLPILYCYNGQRGSWKGMKWLYYFYYPAHLVLIGALRLLLHGNISSIF